MEVGYPPPPPWQLLSEPLAKGRISSRPIVMVTPEKSVWEKILSERHCAKRPDHSALIPLRGKRDKDGRPVSRISEGLQGVRYRIPPTLLSVVVGVRWVETQGVKIPGKYFSYSLFSMLTVCLPFKCEWTKYLFSFKIHLSS